MRALRIVNVIAFIILLIGGLNWLTIGIFGYNFVNALSFGMTAIPTIIFILVGLSALWLIFTSIYEGRVSFPKGDEK